MGPVGPVGPIGSIGPIGLVWPGMKRKPGHLGSTASPCCHPLGAAIGKVYVSAMPAAVSMDALVLTSLVLLPNHWPAKPNDSSG